MFENTSTSEITSVELCIIYLFAWQAVAAHTHHLGGAQRSAPNQFFVLNYAEDLRRRLMAGVLRSTTTRGTAQHNRGIKRKRSITHIPHPCREYFRVCPPPTAGRWASLPVRPALRHGHSAYDPP